MSSRWAQLAERINPRLAVDPSWPALARTIDRAATGYDVETQLPTLARRRPLPNEHPARSLEYRLLDAHHEAVDSAHTTPALEQTRTAATDAAARLTVAGAYRATTQPHPPGPPSPPPRPDVTPAGMTPDRKRDQSPRR
jgi:hypothetical protein